MKKVLGLTLALILLLSATSFCHAEYGEEILFRSIPWGSTYDEAMKILKENTTLDFGYMTYYKTGAKELATGFSVDAQPTNMTVAGNKIKTVELLFAFTFDPETEKQLKRNDSILIRARYIFESGSDATEIENDLIGKLTKIYGDFDKQSNSSFADDYTHARTWFGKNNSKLLLYHNHSVPFLVKSMTTDELTLTYTSGEMNQLLDRYYDYLNKDAKNDMDGL